MATDITSELQQVYKAHSRRVLATLIRLLRDFDLAEEALHEAFTCALEQWPRDGIPDNPTAWLVSTGRFKAIDQIRRQRRFAGMQHLLDEAPIDPQEAPFSDDDRLPDDRLRLIFTCCHPSLNPQARTALTLREVCDLTTEEIAAAFLTKPATIAQRIVRAKRKIQSAAIPYEVPGPSELPGRLDSVLQVIYLVFNEGYSASSGSDLVRRHLAGEGIRLCRLVLELLPQAEVRGLLALMLLQHSRRDARYDKDGDIILLEDQDRSLWQTGEIAEGCALVRRALTGPTSGPYALQAAIAAIHAEAPSWSDTDWPQIVGLYDALLARQNSPVIALNRAVANAMVEGPDAALAAVDRLLANPALAQYFPAFAARAELQRRLGHYADAGHSYRRALELTHQAPERRYIERQMAACHQRL
ncbi:RNA polymerase sigma factor [Gilvimarinus algae]|uniref:RNA polymerase sigma factor n=1 Tax=Gilvimarinus algae TaxID=3058037 RepID=A0ABT8THQ0_9GAMM|nr:RNA polymerase sigma factor [Gilvimarinus sp. SDUM040014]MDO3383629.1 RNA polymerase sigma factor [Gilvimarinus sp. SDUM040014]